MTETLLRHLIKRLPSCHAGPSPVLEGLRFLMHRSTNPERQAFPLTCYCDDSATHEQSQNAVIGGFLMGNDATKSFDWYWSKILDRYRLSPPFKMAHFVRPNGKYIGMYKEMKIALFTELVRTIKHHRLYSLSVSVPQEGFKSLLSMQVYRRLFSPYTCAFLSALMMNHMAMEKYYAASRSQNGVVSYLVDRGSPYEAQLRAGHKLIIEWQGRYRHSTHTGAMATDSDDNVNALQGSDMIAWTVNRRSTTGLTGEFGVLQDLFMPLPYYSSDGNPVGKSMKFHTHLEIPPDGIQMLADGINLWLDSGIMPQSLAEMGTPPANLLGLSAGPKQ